MVDRHKKETIKAYTFLLPAVGLILIFKLYPIIIVIGESFFKVSYLSGTKVFVGINNYIDLFLDRSFWNSVWVTTKLNLLINPIQVAIAVVMALLINLDFKGKMFYRFLFFIPLGVSLAVTTIYWSIIFRPGNGIMNYILNALGLPMQPFFNSPTQALWIIIIIASWKGCSFWMLFVLAGLKNIPKEIYEACQVEGVGTIPAFFHITLPLLSRTLLFIFVTDTAANFMLFIPVFMITKGGPDSSTNVLMHEAYKTAMLQGDVGHGMAMIAFLMFMLIGIIAIQFKTFGERE
jgi:multiple sugar transport system permease protein